MKGPDPIAPSSLAQRVPAGAPGAPVSGRIRPRCGTTAAHARPQARGGRPALRIERHLVHVDRAGPRCLRLGFDTCAPRTRIAPVTSRAQLSVRVAGKRDPERPGNRDDPPEEVLACVDAIDGPAYILDRTWGARRWNAKASRLFAGWLDADGEKIFCATSSSGPRLER